MKLDFDERIIRKARFASGGTPFGMSYNNLLNLYLTNKRLYAKIILMGKCVADIPLTSISSLGSMKTLGASLPVIMYKAGNKEKKFYFYVHRGLDNWAGDLSNEMKRPGRGAADMEPESAYSSPIVWITAVIGLIAALIAIIVGITK